MGCDATRRQRHISSIWARMNLAFIGTSAPEAPFGHGFGYNFHAGAAPHSRAISSDQASPTAGAEATFPDTKPAAKAGPCPQAEGRPRAVAASDG